MSAHTNEIYEWASDSGMTLYRVRVVDLETESCVAEWKPAGSDDWRPEPQGGGGPAWQVRRLAARVAELESAQKKAEDSESAVCRYLEAEAVALEEDSARSAYPDVRGVLLQEAQVLRRYADKLRVGKHHEAEGDLG